MKHILLSLFVILLTLTCCIVMYSLKIPDMPVHVQQSEEQLQEAEHINPVKENKEVSTDISSDNKQGMENNATDDYNMSEVNQNDNEGDSNESPNYISMIYESTAASSLNKSTAASSAKYEAAAMEAQKLLTIKEKLYLIGVARYLDSSDFSLIKKYISEGATQKELDELWEQIRSKMPEDDYNKVYSIFLKYKR